MRTVMHQSERESVANDDYPDFKPDSLMNCSSGWFVLAIGKSGIFPDTEAKH